MEVNVARKELGPVTDSVDAYALQTTYQIVCGQPDIE